jgi:hypothetical protein
MPATQDDELNLRYLPSGPAKTSQWALRARNSKLPGPRPQREAAIRRRLRPQGYEGELGEAGPNLLTIYEQLRQGKMPNNEQLINAIVSFRDSPAVSNQANRLTPDGQKLLQKIRKLCTTMQEVEYSYWAPNLSD